MPHLWKRGEVIAWKTCVIVTAGAAEGGLGGALTRLSANAEVGWWLGSGGQQLFAREVMGENEKNSVLRLSTASFKSKNHFE